MSERMKQIVLTVVMALFLLGVSLWCWFKPADTFSISERRELKRFPTLTVQTVLDGKFMSGFEDYALDQFPMRDELRTLKALSVRYLYAQQDNNGIYMADGYLSKLEFPMRQNSVDRAASVFQSVCDSFLKDTNANVYFSVIPDKNYFLAEANGYPSIDYQKMVDSLREQMPYMTYIDLFDRLELEDYYRTDSHWRQEKIEDVADDLASGMGVERREEYTEHGVPTPFYGVYAGQSALPLDGEQLSYLSCDTLENCIVYDHENGREIPVYDLNKTTGKDPYEMFLSGSLSLITIENPMADTDRELIIFRDSFGSSIAPLLVECYSKVTLVDIRYLVSWRLGDFIEFDDQDVLFLYSTGVLNNRETLK